MLTFTVTTTAFCAYTIRSRVALQERISSTAIIGKFEVPVLEGWASSVKENRPQQPPGFQTGKPGDFPEGYSKSLEQTRTSGPSKMSLQVEVHELGAVTKPSDIERAIKAAQKLSAQMSGVERTKFEVFQSGRIHFRNFPGYLSHARTTSEAERQVLDVMTLTFLSGNRKRVYTLTKTLDGPAIAQDAHSTADKSWALLTNNLRLIM